MLISLEGEEATGKTTFAYTAPLKVVGFSFDMGAERALRGSMSKLFEGCQINLVPYNKDAKDMHTAWKDFDITVFELPTPIQIDSIRVTGRIPLWTYFIKLFAEAVQDPTVRSIVVDTMTIARRVKADAFLEGLQNSAFYEDGVTSIPGTTMRIRLQQIEYGGINDATRDLYNYCQGSKVNLIATHHLTDEYVDIQGKDGKKDQMTTGKRILEGLKGTHRTVDVAVLMEKAKAQIVGKLVKCGYNLSQEGVPIQNPTWDKVVNIISMSLGERLEFERRHPIVTGT